MKKKRRIAAILVLICLIGWICWGNSALEQSSYVISSRLLPASFQGFRIIHISDLHNATFGKNNENLLNMIRNAQPDMIAITGDLIDSRRTDLDVALQFVDEAVKIAPCYYVSGNHESRIEEYELLRKGLEKAGVVVLTDESTELVLGGETVTIWGVEDPAFAQLYTTEEAAALMEQKLDALQSEEAGYTILLSHRPELFDVYAKYSVDLVLSGHAHGGQFRLPVLGGVFVPSQGFFPEYDAGLVTREQTNMVISRGLGNSLFPFRLNNRPEVVLIELQN